MMNRTPYSTLSQSKTRARPTITPATGYTYRLHVYRYDFTGRDALRLSIVDYAVFAANYKYNYAGVLAARCALFRPLQFKTAEYCYQLIENTYTRGIGAGGLISGVEGERSVPGELCISQLLVEVGVNEIPPRATIVDDQQAEVDNQPGGTMS